MNQPTKPKILYLDDEQGNLDGFYYSFYDQYDIFTTKNQANALEIIKKEDIEVMVVDQKMPDISGIEIVQNLKKQFPDITYILITAYASLRDALKAVNEANIFRLISKPWDNDQIINTLNEAVDFYRIKKDNKQLLIELKEQNIKLQTAYHKVEQSNKLKTAFLANLSHEIRTPLNAIVGFSSLIANTDINKEKQKDFSEIIIENSEGLLHIIDQIVNVSKIETNQINFNISQFQISDLLDELFTIFEGNSNKSIQFIKDIPNETSSLSIETDRAQLKHIFINLLQNAFKFTQLGLVKYGVSMETEASLIEKNFKFNKDIFKDNPQQLFFFVEDTGLGIDSKYHSEILEPFRKLSDDRSDVIGGVGLGLYHTTKIIEKLNGELYLSSEPCIGSKFYFYLGSHNRD